MLTIDVCRYAGGHHRTYDEDPNSAFDVIIHTVHVHKQPLPKHAKKIRRR